MEHQISIRKEDLVTVLQRLAHPHCLYMARVSTDSAGMEFTVRMDYTLLLSRKSEIERRFSDAIEDLRRENLIIQVAIV